MNARSTETRMKRDLWCNDELVRNPKVMEKNTNNQMLSNLSEHKTFLSELRRNGYVSFEPAHFAEILSMQTNKIQFLYFEELFNRFSNNMTRTVLWQKLLTAFLLSKTLHTNTYSLFREILSLNQGLQLSSKYVVAFNLSYTFGVGQHTQHCLNVYYSPASEAYFDVEEYQLGHVCLNISSISCLAERVLLYHTWTFHCSC